MKTNILWGNTEYINDYSKEFLSKIDFILDSYEKKIIYNDIEISVFEYDVIRNYKDIRVFVTDLYNYPYYLKQINTYGIDGKNVVWAPDWKGDSEMPLCYSMKTWEDNKGNYKFDGEEGPWDYRYKTLLNAMKPCKKVMDLGAGNMSLKRLLEDDIKYYPVDNKKYYDNTIVCDLNSSFPDIKVDAIFMCGILEYIKDVDSLISRLKNKTKYIYLSYNEWNEEIVSIKQRQYNGWKNNYTIAELVSIIEKNRFVLEEEIKTKNVERYLIFRRKSILNLK